MTPYRLSLERLILKANPEIKSLDIYRHEELLGKAIQLRMELDQNLWISVNPSESPDTFLEDKIIKNLVEADKIVSVTKLEKIQDFWIKQKKYIATQHDFTLPRFWTKQYWITLGAFQKAYLNIMGYIFYQHIKFGSQLAWEWLKTLIHALLAKIKNEK